MKQKTTFLKFGNTYLNQLTLILMLFISGVSFSQVAGVSFPDGGFNIDGDLDSDASTGDWLGTRSNSYVFDIYPAFPFGDALRASPVTAVSTFRVIDAYDGNDDIFQGGGKYTDDPSTWKVNPNGKSGGKGDINNVLLHVGQDNNGDQWVIVASDRLVTTGTSYLDFEFLQKPLTYNNNTTGFITQGVDGGRTVGDILISVSYTNGGSLATVRYYEWEVDATSALGYNYIENTSTLPTRFGAGNIGTVSTNIGAFGVNQYTANQFVEAAINISAFFNTGDPCDGLTIGTILVKTKSSDADTAALDDVVAPIPVRLNLGTAEIDYADADFCSPSASVNLLGVTGGTFSASPSGLTINSSTGEIDVANSNSGTYTVTYSFTTGTCPKSVNTTVVIPETSPTPTTINQDFCKNTGIKNYNVTATPGYTLNYYASNDPAANPLATVPTVDTDSAPAGLYTVYVSQNKAGSCESDRVPVSIQVASALVVSENITNVACFEDSNGAIDLSVSGGSGAYVFEWKDSSNTVIAATEDVSGLKAGTYTVTITSGSCVFTEDFIVGQPSAALSVVSTVTDVLCFDDATGSIDISVSGGTAPYTYLWSTGSDTEDISGLIAGGYSVQITDANGCILNSDVITVGQPSATLSVVSTVTDVLCFDDATGSIDISVSGGTAPYTYLWSTGSDTEDISGLIAGGYSVQITDANGCILNSDIITVGQPSATLSVVSTVTDVLCFDDATGSIDISVSGGTAPYTYLWSTGSDTEDISGLIAGGYSVQITDANGCILNSDVITVGQPSATLSVVSTVTDVLCFDDATGSIDISVSGGTAPYTYLWSTGSDTEDISGLIAGGYSVQITDANGCILNSDVITVGQPSATLSVVSTVTDVLCFDDATGSIDISVSGGTAPYTYLWSTGSDTEDISGLIAGGYSVQITDANGCILNSDVITVGQPSATLSVVSTVTDVLCFDDATGSIDISVSGGTAPYTYLWSTGSDTEDISGLIAGGYSVQITDANGCILNSDVITVGQPSATLSVVSTVTDVLCFDDATGSIDISVSGGTAPYTYLWSTGSDTEDISGLIAGGYSVQITDANGCILNSDVITVGQPSATLSVVSTVTDVLCFDDATGSIDISVSGGTAPYTYLWSTGSDTEDISGLIAGGYSVQITDANGCILNSDVITVGQPSATLSVVSTVTDVLCFDDATGSIDISVSGGTAPYTYLWSTGSDTEDISGLIAGGYSVQITDANGCILNSDVITVGQPSATLSVVSTVTDVLCFDDATGSIDISVSGGTAPYTYLWSTGSDTEDISGLIAGGYSVQITDANGCILNSDVITVGQPSATLSVVSTVTDVLCFDDATGSIDISVSGGTAPYTYLWSTGSDTEDISGLIAGGYSVQITDANGCILNSDVITVGQPSATLSVVSTVTDVLCFDDATGSIDISVSGGTAPYTYLWSTGSDTEDISGLIAGGYSVQITDANGCILNSDVITVGQPSATLSVVSTVTDVLCFDDATGSIDISVSGGTAPYTYLWSTGSDTEDISGLIAGGYSVQITDANGCILNSDVITVGQPSATLSVVSTVTDVLCFDDATGSIDISVSGGTAPYTYLWSTGSDTEDISGLIAGGYSVQITDANGCILNSDVITVGQPSATLSVVSTVTDVLCFDDATGSIDISVSGGTAPYTYLWSTGSDTEDISGLIAGGYSVQITDANGCILNSDVITVGQPSATLSVVSTVTDVLCFDDATGSIDISVSGGTAPYTYLWSTGSDTEDISGLIAGGYSVQITDANGCILNSDVITVGQPSATLSVVSTVTDVLCFDDATGSIDISVSGGTAPYTYLWSTGSDTEDISGLIAGGYSVQITDANGCILNSDVITVGQPSATLSVVSTVTDVLCFDDATGSIDISVSGGTAPYTYLWSTGSDTEDISGLIAGGYSVQITDANGCILNSDVITVGQPSATLSVVSTVTDVLCFDDATGSIDISVSGGTAPYTYLWSTGSDTEDISGLIAGGYSVQITDANGCILNSDVITVGQPSATLSVVSTVTDVLCFDDATGSIDISVSGGTAPYTYLWSTGSDTEDISGLIAGGYSVQITDANGCILNSDVITVGQPSATLSVVSTVTDVLCFDDATGSIDISVSGGTAPYTYLWSTGSDTEDISGLIAGGYSVQITDANGCILNSDVITVGQPSATLSVVSTVTDVLCFDDATGSIDISVSGGTAPYTYLWSTGSDTEDISGLIAGGYSVQITDANGCILNSDVITVGQPSATLSVVSTVTDVLCFDDATGSIDISVSGGTAPYTYLWSTGSDTEDISGLIAGGYSVQITDANGCILNSDVITVGQPSATLSVVSTVTDVLCFDDATGSIDISVSGGTAPYTYLWSTGSDTEDISGLIAGGYSVQITDANGCILNSDVITVGQPSATLSVVSTVTDVLCFDDATGSIDISVSGGTAPYTYLWSTGSDTEDISGLIAGGYSVQITDANGCILNSDVITVGQPSATLSVVSTVTDVLCFDDATGSIDISVSGGTAPYTYLWSTGSDTEDISGLIAGGYSVQITDANGCILNSDVITVGQPSATLSVVSTVTDVLCFDDATGSIDISVSGGTAPYTYLWSTGSDTEDISGLIAGGYSVQITDANGCILNSDVITVGQPSATLSVVSTVTDVLCFDDATGSIDISVSGGTAPYTYLWSTGSDTEDISGLIAGGYSVQITDANGCILNSDVITVGQPSATLSVVSTVTDVLCFDDATGSIDISVSGGTAPYTYLWSTGSDTEDISGLIAGGYSVQITDANGCILNSDVITVGQPSATLSVVSTVTDVLCFDDATGSIDISVSGGTAPYTYLWSTGSDTEDISGLIAGGYSVQITDANGCILNSDVITVGQPSATLSVVSTVTDVLCFDDATGSIDISVSGGTAPYTYLWSTGSDTEDISGLIAGGYSVQITDANGCILNSDVITVGQPSATLSVVSTVTDVLCFDDATGSIDISVSGGTAPYAYLWSNGAITEDLSGLDAGIYTVTITDANGCETTARAEVTQPDVLTASALGSRETCNEDNDGGVDLTVSGGTAPYTYLWSNGAITEDLSGLDAGIYTVTVTDANGCETTARAEVTQPDVLTASALGSRETCNEDNDGGVDLTVSGGTAPYTYLWSNGAITEDLSGLDAGIYTVTITDANGCETTARAEVTQPDVLTASALGSRETCNEDNDGGVDLTVSGGTAPYTYLWSNGAITEDLSGLDAGIYTVTVTDANGCETTARAEVTQPDVLTASALGSRETCNEDNDGGVDLTVSGGTAPYTYLWSNGAITEDLSGLDAGIYTVTITDANGCETTARAEVTQPDVLTASALGSRETCNEDNDGGVDLTVSGGTAPYTYLWSNGAITEDLSGLDAGIYTVTITDANGCETTARAEVTQPDVLTASALGSRETCNEDNDGGVDLTVSGGTAPYTYLWSNGAITEDLSGLDAGIYTVTVTDANGCETTARAEVTQPDVVLAPVSVGDQEVCETGPIETLTALATVPDGFNVVWYTAAEGGDVVADPVLSDVGSVTYYAESVNIQTGCVSLSRTPVTLSICNNSQISLIKTSVLGDENGDGFAQAGETIVYTFTVTNTGNARVSDISIDDAKLALADLVIEPSTLAPGESGVATATYTITQADIDARRVTNTALATGTDPFDNEVTDVSDNGDETADDDGNGDPADDPTVTDLPALSSLSAEKSVTFSDENGNLATDVGETLIYTFSITNTGNTTLYDILIEDPLVEVIGGPIDLAPGATDSSTFTAVYTITAEDIANQQVINQALVSASTAGGDLVEDLTDDPDNPADVDANGDGEPDDPTVYQVTGVLAQEDIEIFNFVTPNDDGFNDYFQIENIENFPNRVQVFNKWGVQVFETRDYNPDTGNVFRGYSDARATVNRSLKLPSGTYFYIINYEREPGDMRNVAGYLYIN